MHKSELLMGYNMYVFLFQGNLPVLACVQFRECRARGAGRVSFWYVPIPVNKLHSLPYKDSRPLADIAGQHPEIKNCLIS
jgi:hypothetical protein